MTAGVLAIAGCAVAVAVLARRREQEFERFWRDAVERGPVLTALLERLAGVEKALAWSWARAREVRAAGEPDRAGQIERATASLEASTREERRTLARLRRVLGSREMGR